MKRHNREKRGQRVKKYLFILGAALITLFVKSVASAETDIDYSGVVRDYSGLNPESQVDTAGMQIVINDNVSYNVGKERYTYTVSDADAHISSNVMDGMIVQNPVLIEPDDGVNITLRCDGNKVDADLNNITDAGNYIVQIKDDNGMVKNIFSFTIIGSESSTITEYNMPSGFSVQSVLYNDEKRDTKSSVVNFKSEGKYYIQYECKVIERTYELNLVIDRTPPVLKLDGVKNGKISGPVSLADLEPGATVTATLNGKNIDVEGKQKLTVSGKYNLVVTDAAGNESTYDFTILVYINNNGYVFVALLLFIIVGITVYLIVSRKKLKIR